MKALWRILTMATPDPNADAASATQQTDVANAANADAASATQQTDVANAANAEGEEGPRVYEVMTQGGPIHVSAADEESAAAAARNQTGGQAVLGIREAEGGDDR